MDSLLYLHHLTFFYLSPLANVFVCCLNHWPNQVLNGVHLHNFPLFLSYWYSGVNPVGKSQLSISRVCLCRSLSTNTLSWQWCQTVFWIFTASSQGSNTLMLTRLPSKPTMATNRTNQRIEAHRWRGELCHWGEAPFHEISLHFIIRFSFTNDALFVFTLSNLHDWKLDSRPFVFLFFYLYIFLWFMAGWWFILKITLECLLFDFIDCHCHNNQAICSHSIINFPWWLLCQIDYWSDCPMVEAPSIQILQVAPWH